jgi:serine protease Do
MRQSRIVAVSMVSMLVASAGTLGYAGLIQQPAQPVSTSVVEPDATQRHAMTMAFNISEAFSYAAEQIEPSVVHITTRTIGRRGMSQGELGSGVIVDARGYILTNNHVIADGNSILVRLNDGRELPAEVIGTFAESDIGVIKVEADDLIPAKFGDSEALRVGQWVLAVGSPFGFDQTVTAGIVSAKGRGSFGPDSQNTGGVGRLQEFIQTDAAINPGNSGGPLVDLYGNIVGINTAIISRTGSNNGLGFAIPADIAQSVMEQIIETGDVQRGWLGISMEPLNPAVAHDMGISGGVVIGSILDDGPAERAGLEAGDIITAIGGRTTENLVRLSNAIMLTKPNQPVEVSYIRDGDPRTSSAIVSDRDEGFLLSNGGAVIKPIGIGVVPQQMRRMQGGRRVAVIPGFLVVDIDRNSPADMRGLERGDFIVQVDGQEFDSTHRLERYFRNASSDMPIRIEFLRDGQAMYIEVIPD